MEILPSPPPRGQSSAQTVQALKLKIEAGVSLSFFKYYNFSFCLFSAVVRIVRVQFHFLNGGFTSPNEMSTLTLFLVSVHEIADMFFITFIELFEALVQHKILVLLLLKRVRQFC